MADCFAEGTTIVTSAEDLATYINDHPAISIHTLVTKRTYENVDVENTEDSVPETILDYTIYAGALTDEDKVTFYIRALDADNACVNIGNETLGENAGCCVYQVPVTEETVLPALYDVYKTAIDRANLTSYFSNMFVGKDYVVEKDAMDNALAFKELRIVSDTPADAVFATMLLGENFKEVVAGQFDYDLTVANDTAVPSRVSAFLQYSTEETVESVNDAGETVTETSEKMNIYSVNVSFVAFEDPEDIKDYLTMECGCNKETCECPDCALHSSPWTFTDMDTMKYAKASVNVRDLPCKDGEKLGSLSQNDQVHITGRCNETGWYRFEYKDGIGYGHGDYFVNEKVKVQVRVEYRNGKMTGDPHQDPNIVWETTNYPGMPRSIDGYELFKIFETDTEVGFYTSPIGYCTDGNKLYGELQRQCAAIAGTDSFKPIEVSTRRVVYLRYIKQ